MNYAFEKQDFINLEEFSGHRLLARALQILERNFQEKRLVFVLLILMVVFDSEPIDFVCLCMSCSHGLAVGRSVIKDKIVYHGYNCRLKGSLSAYVFKVEKCCNYEEYDSNETFMEYVKKHPKQKNPSGKVTFEISISEKPPLC